MPTNIQVGILEIDGQELDMIKEMDLVEALEHVGYHPTGFDENRILTNSHGEVLCNSKGNVILRSV